MGFQPFQAGRKPPLSSDEPPGAVARDDDEHLVGGRHVVAGRQLLIRAGFEGDAESLDQNVERGGCGEAATQQRVPALVC